MNPKDYFLSGQPFKIKGDNTDEIYRYEPDQGLLRVITNKHSKKFIVVDIGLKRFTIRVFGVMTSHPECIGFRKIIAEASERHASSQKPDHFAMNQILKNFQMLMDSIETKISILEKAYDKASDKWQISETGKAIKNKAGFLNRIVDQLSDWTDELIYK
jgi:hypothetical protein